MRSAATVRQVRPEDLDSLIELCLAARRESLLGSQVCTDDTARLRHQVGILASERGSVGLVGELDGRVQGLLFGRVVGPSLFSDEGSVVIEAVYVAETARRRGIGHALLAGIAAEAERAGVTEVYALPLPGARGVLRFLARLGFAPAAAHRVVSVETLQRRLSGESPARRTPARGIDLVTRRRLARATRSAARSEPQAAAPAEEQAQPALTSISMQVSRAVATRRPRGSSTATS